MAPSADGIPATDKHQDEVDQVKDGVASSASPQLPPLIYIPYPQILPEHEFNLADQGWSTITYADDDESTAQPDPLFRTSQALFQACKTFFSQPEAYKKSFTPAMTAKSQASEAGFCAVPGEKEFITLRDLQSTPDELREPAMAFWREAGGLLSELLGCVSESLGLPRSLLTAYSEPCSALHEQRTATLLRLFRYEGHAAEKGGIVAEPHQDLGLLSLVIGDKPGLEVWDRYSSSWFPIERTYFSPAASVLVGRQLAWLTNGRYAAGRHRVRSYNGHFGFEPPSSRPQQLAPPDMVPSPQNYRYSIVFVLRAHSTMPINSDELTTAITGPFRKPIVGKTAGDLFSHLQKAAFNINAPIEERQEQRRKYAEKKKNGDSETQSLGTG